MRGTIVVFATGLVATASAFQGAPVSAVTSRHAAVSMGANVKELRERVTSVKNTKKITSAMKLVAAAKVRRAQEAVIRSRPFSETLERILGGLLARLSTEALDIPLMETREVHCIDCTAHVAPLAHGLLAAAAICVCTVPHPRRESKPTPTPEPRESAEPKTNPGVSSPNPCPFPGQERGCRGGHRRPWPVRRLQRADDQEGRGPHCGAEGPGAYSRLLRLACSRAVFAMWTASWHGGGAERERMYGRSRGAVESAQEADSHIGAQGGACVVRSRSMGPLHAPYLLSLSLHTCRASASSW